MNRISDSSDELPANACPDSQVLQALLNEQLDATAQTFWTDHVEECSRCESQLQTMCCASDLPTALQHNTRPPDWDNHRVATIIEKLQQTEVVHSSRSPGPLVEHPEIPGFELHAVIGQGGMGTVFRATELATDHTVAIKVLSPAATQKEQAAHRFGREIELTRRCVHPHIVQVLGSGEHRGTHYMTMECVNGTNLSRLVRVNGPLPVNDACEAIRQAAFGLQHAHELGLIHRDVKPSNLLIGNDGVVKLADLGLARIADSFGHDHTELTSTGQIMGTVDYMAPEQTRAGEPVDHRSDLYSLGATLFKLLTGTAPFEGDGYDSLVRKLAALTSNSTPDVADRRDDLPPELVKLVNRLLDSNPKDRFQSAAEIAAALQPYCQDHNLQELAKAVPAHEPIAVVQQTRSLNHTPTPRQVRPQPDVRTRNSSGSRNRLIGMFVALTVVFAAVITLLTDGGRISIECSDPDLRLEIVHNEQVVTEWAAGQLRDYTWFRSGNYEIRIPAEARDQVTVKNGTFQLKRNERRIVTIEVQRTPDVARRQRDIREIWAFNSPALNPDDRSVDILTSDDWEWTEAKPFGIAVNDGVNINVPASPSLTPDGLNMMFGRYEAALTWKWLIAGRDSVTQDFEIRHQLPATFQHDYSMGLFAPVIVSDSEARSKAGVETNTDLFAHALTASGEWWESRIFDNVNSGADENCPTLSADGLTVIFGRRSDSSGSMDLWMATRSSVDVPFDHPRSLGEEINGPHRESSPALSHDQLLLIYHSNAPTKDGNMTLWMATRQHPGEPFTNPQRLLVGDPQKFQLDPALALNGRLLVFRQRSPVVDGLQTMMGNKLYFCERVRSLARTVVKQDPEKDANQSTSTAKGFQPICLDVDAFDAFPEATQDGFIRFTASGMTGTTNNGKFSLTSTVRGVTVRIPEAAYFYDRHPGFHDDDFPVRDKPFGAVLRDFIARGTNDGDLRVVIFGLPAGVFEITSFHNDWNLGEFKCYFDILVDDALGIEQLKVTNAFNVRLEELNTGEKYNVTSSGTSNVVIRIRGKSKEHGTRINGLCIRRTNAPLTGVLPPKPTQGDRAIAELILNARGRITTNSIEFSNVQNLPAEPFIVTGVRIEDRPVPAEVLKRLPELSGLNVLRLWFTQTNDADLAVIGKIVSLRELDLHAHKRRAKISDTGLQHLAALEELRTLHLTSMQIHGPGLVHLQGLKQLKQLSLYDTHVDDNGLAHLAPLKNLQSLMLQNTPITDACIPHLGQLNQLLEIWIRDTGITEAGRKELKTVLPNTSIFLE